MDEIKEWRGTDNSERSEIGASMINAIKEKLIEKLKGTVKVHYLCENGNLCFLIEIMNTRLAENNSLFSYKVKPWDYESTSDEIVDTVTGAYRRWIINKFIKEDVKHGNTSRKKDIFTKPIS